MSEPNLVFLPWARRGGALDLPEDLRDGHPASHASATAEVRVNGAGPATVSVQLLGPGDVTALAPQQVIRTDPAPGTRTFESNYLALVELDGHARGTGTVDPHLGGRRRVARRMPVGPVLGQVERTPAAGPREEDEVRLGHQNRTIPASRGASGRTWPA